MTQKKTSITIYRSANYLGKSQKLLVGYNAGPLEIGNDVLSSIKIPAGWRVTLYENGPETGKELVLTTDVPDLAALNFNNITSNILVEAIDNLPAPKINISQLVAPHHELLYKMAGGEKKREILNGNRLSGLYLAGGFHAQAIGQYSNFVYVAFSESELAKGATLWIYDLDNHSSTKFDLPSEYPHPCCIQVVGTHLVVTVEAAYGTLQTTELVKRKKKSAIVIYNLLNSPLKPVEVTRINQDDTNSGGAGLTFNPQTQRWYIFADQDDHGRMVIYRSKTDQLNEWESTPIKSYKRFGSGAGLNLITASDNSIWGLYYEDSSDVAPDFAAWDMTADVVRLFKILSPDGEPVQQLTVNEQITNVGSPKIKKIGEMLAARPSMRFGASLRNEKGVLELLTCQRNMEPNFKLDRVDLMRTEATAMFVNFGGFVAEMYASSTGHNRHSGHLALTESWNTTLPRSIEFKVKHNAGGPWIDDLAGRTEAPFTLLTISGTTLDADVKFQPFSTSQKLRDRNVLQMREYLLPTQRLISSNSDYQLELTNHGTLEISRKSDGYMFWGKHFKRSDYFARLDEIHGFCLLAGSPTHPGEVLWSTKMPSPCSFLIMQDDGNLCQYKGHSWAPGGFLWGSDQEKEQQPSSLKVKITNVRFTCTFSNDEGAGNDADMDRLYLYAQLNNEPEKTVVAWNTKGEWTVKPGYFMDLGGNLNLTINGDPRNQGLTLRAWTREYDTLSGNEHGHAKFHIPGNMLWELAELRKNQFPSKQFTFDVNSSDAGFRVRFTLEVTY